MSEDDLRVIFEHARKLRDLAQQLRQDRAGLRDEGLKAASETVCKALEGLAAVFDEAENDG